MELTQRRALTLIRFHRTNQYRSEPELLSDVHYKLIRSVAKFDPARGSAFTFVSHLIFNSLRTNATKARKSAGRFVELDEAVTDRLTTAPCKGREALEDVADRIRRGFKTTLNDPSELSAERWMVDSRGQSLLTRLRRSLAAGSWSAWTRGRATID